jgi:hypothetical protein
MASLTTLLSAFALYVASCIATSYPHHIRDATCDSCLTNSLFTPSLGIHELDFHASYLFTTPAHQNSWGYVNFTLTNPANPSDATVCSAQSDQLQTFFYGNQWYTCTSPASSTTGNSSNPTSGPLTAAFRFLFSETESRLDVNQTWECAEARNS